MAALDTLIVVSILFFIATLTWARVMGITVLEVVKEIIEILREALGGE